MRCSSSGKPTRSGGTNKRCSLLSQAIEGFRRTRGAQDERTLRATQAVAEFHLARNQPAQAERLIAETLVGLRRDFGDDHPGTLNAMCSLASIYSRTGRIKESEQLWRDALDGWKRLVGPNHPETLATMVLFAEFLLSQHRDSEAEPLYRETVKEGRKALDRNHIVIDLALGRLAELHLRNGELKAAEGVLIEAVEITRSRYGTDSEITSRANFVAGMLLFVQEEFARAEPYLLDCLPYWLNHHPDEKERWWSELRLGICLLAQGKNAKAQISAAGIPQGDETPRDCRGLGE